MQQPNFDTSGSLLSFQQKVLEGFVPIDGLCMHFRRYIIYDYILPILFMHIFRALMGKNNDWSREDRKHGLSGEIYTICYGYHAALNQLFSFQ